MESTIFTHSGPFRIRREGSWVPHPELVLDDAEDPANGDPELSYVGMNFVDLQGVPRRTRLGALLVTIMPWFKAFFGGADSCFIFFLSLSRRMG